MVKSGGNVTVTTTAQRLVNYSPRRTSLAITNNGTVNVFYGNDSELTSSNGQVIYPTQTYVFSKLSGDNPKLERWIIAASSTADIRVSEEYGEQ